VIFYRRCYCLFIFVSIDVKALRFIRSVVRRCGQHTYQTMLPLVLLAPHNADHVTGGVVDNGILEKTRRVNL